MSIEEYICEKCNRKFDKEEYNITNNGNKCIFHSQKNENNSWISEGYDNSDESAKVKWNKEYVKYFWKEFNIYVDRFEDIDKIGVEIVEFIFPIYWEKYYQHENINMILEEKEITFKSCEFLDRHYFRALTSESKDIAKWIGFSFNCKINQDISFTSFKFINGFSATYSVYNKLLFFNNCTFDDLFEIVNCTLNKVSLYAIDSSSSIEIKYNTKKSFKLVNYLNTLNELHILGNRLNDIVFETNKINNLIVNSEHRNLKDYKIKKVEIVEDNKIERLKFNKNIIDTLTITDSEIRKASFSSSEFNSTEISNNIFAKKIDFLEVLFNNINFKLCNFEELILKDVEIKKELNLATSIYNKKINCFKLITNDINRETARILKDSFEQQNNFIEANKYYAKEMEAYKKELTPSNFIQWIVLKLHEISSEYSQNWILPLIWIFNISALYFLIDTIMFYYVDKILAGSLIFLIVVLIFNYLNKYLKNTFILLLTIFLYIFFDINLNEIAKLINPFSKSNNLTFSLLILKVFVAYLAYQFIISLRQNTRRK